MPSYLHRNQAPPKGQQVPKQDIPRKFSSNTGTQPWASIYRLPKVTPKPLTSHNSLLDTSLHSREKKSSSIHQNTDTSFPNQETLTSYSSTPPTARNLHNKEEPQTARIQKGHPKQSNLNKMKRHRNTQQVKEQDKCPPNQIKEEEIGNLPEKEFRIMIVKMIQNLTNFLKGSKLYYRQNFCPIYRPSDVHWRFPSTL